MVVAHSTCCPQVSPCGCRSGWEFDIWSKHVYSGKRPRSAPLQVSPTLHPLKSQANMTVARVRHAAAFVTLVVLATVGVIPRVEAFNGGLRTALTRPHDGPAAASSASIVGPSSRNGGMFVCLQDSLGRGLPMHLGASSACHGKLECRCRICGTALGRDATRL